MIADAVGAVNAPRRTAEYNGECFQANDALNDELTTLKITTVKKAWDVSFS